MMRKGIAILLCVLLLVPALVIPGAAAGSTQYLAIICPQEYTIVKGDYVEDPDPTHDPPHTIYVAELEVLFKNWGPNPAYNVTATVSYEPAGTEALDPDVTLGYMDVQGTAKDTIILWGDEDETEDIHDNIRWTIKYYDADGNGWLIPNVPYICDPTTFTPQPQEYSPEPTPLTINIKHMTIKWADDNDGVTWSRWSRWSRWSNQEKDVFTIWGRLKLPDGYTRADVVKQAMVSIGIKNSTGSDTVELQKKYLRWWLRGELWTYRGNESPGDGMNITNMVVWWAPDGCGDAGQAGFYVRGVLELDPEIGIGTEPEATVTLEIPMVDDDGSLVGEETIEEFKVYPRLNLWSYYAWPSLPRFPYDPSGTE